MSDEPFRGIVYLITNEVNGKQYVGITSRESHRLRWHGHCSEARKGGGHRLHYAIRKYGEDAFRIEHIASAATWDDLGDTEVALIAQYRTFHRDGNGYNMTRGGDGGFGMIHSEETRAKLREVRKLQVMSPRSPESRLAMSIAQKGKPKSAEGRAAIAAAMETSGFREKNRLALTGKPKSPEHKAALKASWANRINKTPHKGMNHSAETKAAMSLARKGKPLSDLTLSRMRAPESRQKRSAAQREIMAKRRLDNPDMPPPMSHAELNKRYKERRWARLVVSVAIASFYKPRPTLYVPRPVVAMVKPVQLSLLDLL